MPSSWPACFLFPFCLFFLYDIFIIKILELACNAYYGVMKTSSSKHNNKGRAIAFPLKVCSVLDPSPNIRLTKDSKINVKAKQLI